MELQTKRSALHQLHFQALRSNLHQPSSGHHAGGLCLLHGQAVCRNQRCRTPCAKRSSGRPQTLLTYHNPVTGAAPRGGAGLSSAVHAGRSDETPVNNVSYAACWHWVPPGAQNYVWACMTQAMSKIDMEGVITANECITSVGDVRA